MIGFVELKEQKQKVKELEMKGKAEKNGFRRQILAQQYVQEKQKLEQLERMIDR